MARLKDATKRMAVAIFVALTLASLSPASAQGVEPLLHNAQVPLPSPHAGSFFTVFDYLRDGRIVAFDGFTVFRQVSEAGDEFTPIGILPAEFSGATDPAFVVVSPDGSRLLLGAGAGGSKYPDPAFNGNIFELPSDGGTATLVGTFPFHIQGTFFSSSDRFVFGQGETFGTFVGSIELLDLRTRQARSLIGHIPGDPGGIDFDRHGNLFVGLGAAADPSRTGEIRRFDRTDVLRAMWHSTLLDFDTDSTLVAEVLNAGDLDFDLRNRLFVGGADFAEPDLGYVAEVDVTTGQVVNRFDPVDGDPNDGDVRFYEIAFNRVGCQLGSLDLFSFFNPEPEIIFQRGVCTSPRHRTEGHGPLVGRPMAISLLRLS